MLVLLLWTGTLCPNVPGIKIDESAGIYDYYNAYDNVDVYRGAGKFCIR